MDGTRLFERLERINESLMEKFGLEYGREFELIRMAKVTEEVGELADAVLALQGLQRDNKKYQDLKKHLGYEAVDVMVSAYLLAVAARVDIKQLINERLKIIEERVK